LPNPGGRLFLPGMARLRRKRASGYSLPEGAVAAICPRVFSPMCSCKLVPDRSPPTGRGTFRWGDSAGGTSGSVRYQLNFQLPSGVIQEQSGSGCCAGNVTDGAAAWSCQAAVLTGIRSPLSHTAIQSSPSPRLQEMLQAVPPTCHVKLPGL
jgi:hypothetical protein